MSQSDGRKSNCPGRSAIVVPNEFGGFRRALVPEPPPRRTVARTGENSVTRAKSGIKRRIARAGETLRRLPRPPELAQLEGRASAWPAVIREFADLIGNDRVLRARASVRPGAPSPRAIAELDEVLRWVLWLDLAHRRIVVAKMHGLGFRKIAEILGKPRNGWQIGKIAAQYDNAIELILLRIVEKSGIPMPPVRPGGFRANLRLPSREARVR
jgi:hypothetical protein